MRRLIWLSVVIALVLTGCLAKPKEKEALPEPGELVILSHVTSGPGRDALEQVISEFETKYPQVRVQVKAPDATTRQAPSPVSISPSAFAGIDLVIGNGGHSRQLKEMGLLKDLSSLNLPPFDPLVADFVPTSFSNGEQTVFIPLEFTTSMFMLNVETFKKRGLAIPEVDWTYADFEALLQDLKRYGETTWMDPFELANMAVYASGAQYYDQEKGKWTFDTPQTRAGLTYVRRLIEEGLIADKYLGPGRAGIVPAMTLNPWRHNFEPGIPLPAPVGSAGRAMTSYYGHGVVMLGTTSRPEASAAFIKELLSSSAYAQVGIRPVFENPQNLAVWREQVGERTADVVEVALSSLRHTRPAGSTQNYFTKLELFLQGQIPLDQLVRDLDSELNSGS